MPATCATSLRASSSLGPRPSACRPRASNSVIALSSAPSASCARLAAISGTPFFSALLPARSRRAFSLSAAKPTQNGAFFCAATQARMSGFSSNSSVGVRPLIFLIFCSEAFLTFQSATAATRNEDVAALHAPTSPRRTSARALRTLTRSTPAGVSSATGPLTSVTSRAGLARRARHRVAHLAGARVGDARAPGRSAPRSARGDERRACPASAFG